jgi:hypothetical protein
LLISPAVPVHRLGGGGALPARSCIIDGETIVCDDNGLAVYDLSLGAAAGTISWEISAITKRQTAVHEPH